MTASSIFSKIKVTSPAIEALRKDVRNERRSFVESLTTDQLAKVFPASANLGTTSNGKPISTDAIAQQANTVPVVQTKDGSKVMLDPKTGKLIIVADNPDDVEIQNPEDAEKLQQLSQLAVQTQAGQQATPSAQDTAHQQNVAQQRAIQQQSMKRVSEADNLNDFISTLTQLLSPDESGASDDSDEADKNNETDSSDDEHPTADDGLVQVSQVSDSLSSPVDVISALGDSFWTPPDQKDLVAHVATTQATMGAAVTPVEEKPIEKPRPNMAQYVKTGLNPMGTYPGNVIGNDFDDVLGIDSPISIKLAIELGK